MALSEKCHFLGEFFLTDCVMVRVLLSALQIDCLLHAFSSFRFTTPDAP